MQKQLGAILSIVLLLSMTPSSQATDYYVNIEGSNASTGLSETEAWRTIAYSAMQCSGPHRKWRKSCPPQVLQSSLGAHSEMDLSNLPGGMYFLRIDSSRGVLRGKFLKMP